MRGGRRAGAGRPPKEISEKRPTHGVRAYPEEWKLIKRFIKLTRTDIEQARTILTIIDSLKKKGE